MKKHLTFSLALLTIACSTVSAQLPSYLPADGLVGWWPFNGNANDESGNGNDGVVNGATLTEDRFGNLNAAYGFDEDFIVIPSSEDFNSNNISISLWSKTSNLQRQCAIIRLTYINASNEHFGIVLNDEIPFGVEVAAKYDNPNCMPGLGWEKNEVVANILDSSYHHIVGIIQNNILSIYIDGQIRNQLSIAFAQSESCWGGDLQIGRNWSGHVDYFHGSLDDIAIYNRALTPQEIENLYTSTNETVDTGDGAAPLPQCIPYQAAARDAQGQAIVSAPVNVRFSLHEGAVDGAVSYSETHALTTNSIGLFNTVFGNGTPEQSAFDSINWAATTKFLQVEIDLGEGYVDMGTTQLLSVPYAFRSDEAARIKNAGLPIFADNAAALAGGLVAGEMYRTASGDLKVVY